MLLDEKKNKGDGEGINKMGSCESMKDLREETCLKIEGCPESRFCWERNEGRYHYYILKILWWPLSVLILNETTY